MYTHVSMQSLIKQFRLDEQTHKILGILADFEKRTLIDEFRFLVNERAKVLKIKEVSQ